MVKHDKVEKMSFQDFKADYLDYACHIKCSGMWFAPYTCDGACDTRFSHHVDILYVVDTLDYDECIEECPYDEDSDEYDEYVDRIMHEIIEGYKDVYAEKIDSEYESYCEWVYDMNEMIEDEDEDEFEFSERFGEWS